MASPSPSPPPPRALSPNDMHHHNHQHHHPQHQHQQQHIPEDTLRNIDLGSTPAPASQHQRQPSSKKGLDLEAGGPRRAAPAAAGGGDDGTSSSNEAEQQQQQQQQQQQEQPWQQQTLPTQQQQQQQQQQQRASSCAALLLAQCKRFDVELAAVCLAGILVTTACAIFTKDEGWFRLEAPTREPAGLAGATVVYHIGLSTYTAQAHAARDPSLVLYTHQGDLGEASTAAEHIAYALYAFLVLSLVSAAGILWYIALFHEHLKDFDRGREGAVRGLGLQALALGAALLGLGTAAFRLAVARAFVQQSFAVATADGSPFSGVDTAGRRLQTEYAYHLTGLTWFLWLLVGGVLLFRSCCWAKRAGAAQRGDFLQEAEAEAEAGGAAGARAQV